MRQVATYDEKAIIELCDFCYPLADIAPCNEPSPYPKFESKEAQEFFIGIIA
jgi:hypothetical protein